MSDNVKVIQDRGRSYLVILLNSGFAEIQGPILDQSEFNEPSDFEKAILKTISRFRAANLDDAVKIAEEWFQKRDPKNDEEKSEVDAEDPDDFDARFDENFCYCWQDMETECKCGHKHRVWHETLAMPSKRAALKMFCKTVQEWLPYEPISSAWTQATQRKPKKIYMECKTVGSKPSDDNSF